MVITMTTITTTTTSLATTITTLIILYEVAFALRVRFPLSKILSSSLANGETGAGRASPQMGSDAARF
ncbi:hypothetical protein SLEP1_g12630 [Rubroshorea leprosula]|uniref:Uncharacterized protein n=1 Tax=Rubroshorea leprosula TaxID=152421 RepID=A0AAV5IHM0_9ROSI|nr:hypothetical protein SLEP1_g12630 [Rubroshorea leprosula]